MPDNKGFRLTYFGDMKEIELHGGRDSGVMFYDNLKRTAEDIARRWVLGDWGWDDLGNRKNYYFDSRGGFAAVSKRNAGEMPVLDICFVNKYLEDLEKAVRSFNLPFDANKVYCEVEH